MNNVIGIDLGGTSIKAGRIEDGIISGQCSLDTRASEGGEVTLNVLRKVIQTLKTSQTTAIGIGVPSVVDKHQGIVYNVQNIRNWEEVHLKTLLEAEFQVPVFIDNDANCFAIGEKYFGAAQEYDHFVGITLGTGVGGGIVQCGKLLKDANCGSGEFGEIPYGESIIEDYCGSRFFLERNGISGFEAYQKALKGDEHCLGIFQEYGKHMANLIKIIVLTVDPQAIVLGGSISASFPLFKVSMNEELKKFPYTKTIQKLVILTSDLENSGILGAGVLCY
jgi:Transcriptional regulator/sugar kinase